jgi:sarcosine oxidase subunit gamma
VVNLTREARWTEAPVHERGLRLSVVTNHAVAKLQAPGATTGATISALLSLRLPPPCRLAQQPGLAVAGLAPGEWLLLADVDSTITSLLARLQETLTDEFASSVDLTHANTLLQLAGPGAGDVIATLCPLDLSDQAFPPGSAARSLLGEVGVLVMRREAAECFDLLVDQTVAPYAWRLLAQEIRASG